MTQETPHGNGHDELIDFEKLEPNGSSVKEISLEDRIAGQLEAKDLRKFNERKAELAQFDDPEMSFIGNRDVAKKRLEREIFALGTRLNRGAGFYGTEAGHYISTHPFVVCENMADVEARAKAIGFSNLGLEDVNDLRYKIFRAIMDKRFDYLTEGQGFRESITELIANKKIRPEEFQEFHAQYEEEQQKKRAEKAKAHDAERTRATAAQAALLRDLEQQQASEETDISELPIRKRDAPDLGGLSAADYLRAQIAREEAEYARNTPFYRKALNWLLGKK